MTLIKSSLAGTLKVQFDGFALLRFAVSSKRPVHVDSLAMDFPLRKERSLYARGRDATTGDRGTFAAMLRDRGDTGRQGRQPNASYRSVGNGPLPLVATSHRTNNLLDDCHAEDTIIAGGHYVRYIGIDAPELYPEPEAYGREAWLANRRLVEGKTVRLERDISDTDRYGRLLR